MGGPFTVLPMKFGRYQILKELGRGQMGAVYLAQDTELDRPVALKVARTSSSGSAKLLKRMEVEAKAAAVVDHPHICKVYDAGEIDGIRFIALQYVEGEDLKKFLKRTGRRLEPKEAVRIILQILRALEAAHEKGIIHRDLKPENVMLNKKNEPVIMDFGLARRTIGSSDAGLTQGMVIGTAAYMSPEQAIGKAEGIDHRSDLYAVGVMLFEMLTGAWPFSGGAIEVMGKKCVQEPPSPLSINPELPSQLAVICHKMIAQKKEERYETCAEVINALDGIDLKILVQSELRGAQSKIAPSLDFLKELSTESGVRKPLKPLSKARLPQKSNSAIATLLDRCWNRKSPIVRWTVSGGTAAGLLLFGAILFFGSGNAFVRIQILADDVQVTFQGDTIALVDGAREFKVKAGGQMLHVKSGNVEFDTDKFALNRGHNPTLTVDLVNSDIVAKFGHAEVGRRSITSDSAGLKKDGFDDRVQTSNTKEVNQSESSRELSSVANPLRGQLDPATGPLLSHPTKGKRDDNSGNAAGSDVGMIFISPTAGITLKRIPAGTFLMGSPETEPERSLQEGPQHTVAITQAFFLGVCEVTQTEYSRVMGVNPSWFSQNGGGRDKIVGLDTGRFPVEQVSWYDAVAFCNRLSELDGLSPFYIIANPERDGASIKSATVSFNNANGYRLPTEAQWEYACRAGTTGPFYFGGELTGKNANFNGNVPYGTAVMVVPLSRPTTVGSYPANGFGLHDMHGNVAEWCFDVFDGNAYQRQSGIAEDPIVISGAVNRAKRDACWIDYAKFTRSANRYGDSPGVRKNGIGFRVACQERPAKATRFEPTKSSELDSDPKRISIRPQFRVGDLWKGYRTYQKGWWAGKTVHYELHISEVTEGGFKGHVFDNGAGRNRAEVIGYIKGEKIEWQERLLRPNSDDHTDVVAEIADEKIHLRFDRYYDRPHVTEGIGELTIETASKLPSPTNSLPSGPNMAENGEGNADAKSSTSPKTSEVLGKRSPAEERVQNAADTAKTSNRRLAFEKKYPLETLRVVRERMFNEDEPFRVLNESYIAAGVMGIRSQDGVFAWNFDNLNDGQLIKMRLRIKSGNGRVGISLTQHGDAHGVSIWLTGDRQLLIQPGIFAKQKRDFPNQDLTQIKQMRPVGQWNELALAVTKQSLEIFVNNQPGATLNLNNYELTPMVVQFAISCGGDTTVELDEYQIYEPE